MENELDKSELPTQFKLGQARRRGMVARGTDLGFLIALTVLVLYGRVSGEAFAGKLSAGAREFLISGPRAASPDALFAMIGSLLHRAAAGLTLLFAMLFLAVLIFELVQTGVVFSAKPLKPDFSRLNPVQGLKRLFSMRLLLETVKNVLKFASYVTVAVIVIRRAMSNGVGMIVDGTTLAWFMAGVSGRLLLSFILVAMVFAALDQILSRRMFLKQMRMSRREVKREIRDREGDSRLKQKRKQLHAAFVKTSQSIRNLPGADVLVTNPEHIAVALRYDAAQMSAPQIVSVGTNQVAQRLKRLAIAYGVPVVENRQLARTLLRGGALDRSVPEHCYAPVAEIYNELRRANLLSAAVR